MSVQFNPLKQRELVQECGLLLVAVLLLDLLDLLWSRPLPGRVHDGHARAGHRVVTVPWRAH